MKNLYNTLLTIERPQKARPNTEGHIISDSIRFTLLCVKANRLRENPIFQEQKLCVKSSNTQIFM